MNLPQGWLDGLAFIGKLLLIAAFLLTLFWNCRASPRCSFVPSSPALLTHQSSERVASKYTEKRRNRTRVPRPRFDESFCTPTFYQAFAGLIQAKGSEAVVTWHGYRCWWKTFWAMQQPWTCIDAFTIDGQRQRKNDIPVWPISSRDAYRIPYRKCLFVVARNLYRRTHRFFASFLMPDCYLRAVHCSRHSSFTFLLSLYSTYMFFCYSVYFIITQPSVHEPQPTLLSRSCLSRCLNALRLR